MVVKIRRKFSRKRGSWTHGWGEKKKHRGAGHRGGRGMAGTGKRGDAKKPSIWANTRYFGKRGFTKHGIVREVRAINISELEENLAHYLSKKLVEQKDNTFVIDLSKLGYNKLLGNGRVSKRLFISAEKASSGALQKVKEAGGEVIIKK